MLSNFIDIASKAFKGYFRGDLLVRGKPSIDTSLARYYSKRNNASANISILTQANSVHANPIYQKLLQNRTVILFDDFTTSGMSLDWARLVIRAAGARRIILLAVGKYGTTYQVFSPAHGVTLHPFELYDYGDDPNKFSYQTFPLSRSRSAPIIINKSFARVLRNEPMEITHNG